MNTKYATKGPFAYIDVEGVMRTCRHVFVLVEIRKKTTGVYLCEKCQLKRYGTIGK